MTKIILYVKESFVNGTLARLGVPLRAWLRSGHDSSGQRQRCCRVMLACAVAAVLVARWRRAASVPRRALWWWRGSVALFGAGVAAFDDLVYGGLLSSGY